MTRDIGADEKKSSFKETPVNALFPPNIPKDKYVKALVLQNEKGEAVRAFVLDETTEKKTTGALSGAAHILNGFHAMMRIEITGGW